MTKILYLKKVFANNAIFSKIMSQSKDFFWLIQAPNISKHIFRNGGATFKASRKTALNKVFFYFGGKKAIFSQKMAAPSKNVIALNMYIGTKVLVYERWLVLKVGYTASRPNAFAIPYSPCLCMWVNNNKSNLYVFLLDSNGIFSYIFKEVIKVRTLWSPPILEITQDALCVGAAAQVQTSL